MPLHFYYGGSSEFRGKHQECGRGGGRGHPHGQEAGLLQEGVGNMNWASIEHSD